MRQAILAGARNRRAGLPSGRALKGEQQGHQRHQRHQPGVDQPGIARDPARPLLSRVRETAAQASVGPGP